MDLLIVSFSLTFFFESNLASCCRSIELVANSYQDQSLGCFSALVFACIIFNYLLFCICMCVCSLQDLKIICHENMHYFNLTVFTCVYEWQRQSFVSINMFSFHCSVPSLHHAIFISLKRIVYFPFPSVYDYLSAKYYSNMHFHISLTKTL